MKKPLRLLPSVCALPALAIAGRRFVAASLALALTAGLAVGQSAAPADKTARPEPPKVYVPYKDLAAVIDPSARTVLMDRQEFQKLLAAAGKPVDGLELGKVVSAQYSAAVVKDRVELTGELMVRTLAPGVVSVPLGFAQMGLTSATLDGQPAPLGYDAGGRLVLLVSGKGEHKLAVAGSSPIRDLTGGGTEFGLILPAAAAGEMKLEAPGDLAVHATVPISASRYDKSDDRTRAVLTLGGQSAVTVVLMGNGRQEDQRAILLGESATSVQLTKAGQTLHCIYTVQVLRRGVGELSFHVPAGWTVTDVSCPDLVRWDVAASKDAGGPQALTIRLRNPEVGLEAVHIQAQMPSGPAQQWQAPVVSLVGAAFQRGFLTVDAGEGLSIRNEKLADARREDRAAAAGGLAGALGIGDRLYYHWGDKWSVAVETAAVELRRTSESRQDILVSSKDIRLSGRFDVTAVGREMYDVSFLLPPALRQWELVSVTVNGQTSGFEYRLNDAPQPQAGQTLVIELASATRPEAMTRVNVVLRHVPQDGVWAAGADTAGAKPTTITVPLIRPQTAGDAGLVAVSARDYLAATSLEKPPGMEDVPVGRMASLGLDKEVSLAWSYPAAVGGDVKLQVAREQPRVAARAVGLVAASPGSLSGTWRVTYNVTRAAASRLELLADKSLGDMLKIDVLNHRLASKRIIAREGAPARYDVWELTLDGETAGEVIVAASYERPLPEGRFDIPLVRPWAAQTNEWLALEASEELAVTADVAAPKAAAASQAARAAGASEIDAIDLPPLPRAANRILAAYRLDNANTADGGAAGVAMTTSTHQNYPIPTAVAACAEYTTHLGLQGRQQTEAVFQVSNAGLQFLQFRLPPSAQLWSARVADRQAKPRADSAGNYLLAIPRSTQPVDIGIVYAWTPPSGGGSDIALGAAALVGVNVNQVRWTVTPPPGYRLSSRDTRMETRDLKPPTPAYARLIDAFSHAASPSIMPECAYTSTSEDERISLDSSRPPSPSRGAASARTGAAASQPADFGFGDGHEITVPVPEGGTLLLGGQSLRYHEGVLAMGRYTLPVELISLGGAGQSVTFTSLGRSDLTVSLVSESAAGGWGALGFGLIAVAGWAIIRKRPGRKSLLVVLTCAAASLLAIWWPSATAFANGAFWAALALIPFYILAGLWGRLWRLISRRRIVAAVAAVLLAMAMSLAASRAEAAAPASAQPANQPPAQGAASGVVKPAEPVVVPYDGDPTQADQSTKVLVPYGEFVRLWNQAHPDQPIEVPESKAAVAMADVRYAVSLAPEPPAAGGAARAINLILTAQVKTTGKGYVMLPMPFSGLAVTEATLGGKPAQLRNGPKGTVLLEGGTAGELKITAVATPVWQGRKGSIDLSLPPLPGAVATVLLPDDLVLEAPGIEGALSGKAAAGGTAWTLPMGTARTLSLRWMPKPGGGAADRTLSAMLTHDVHFFNWAMVGVSVAHFTFSGVDVAAGQTGYDRFAILVPAGLTLTDVAGANLKDYREVSETVVDGRKFRVVEIRLQKPAAKEYDLTLRWLSDLPAMKAAGASATQQATTDKPLELPLPQAADVGRESGRLSIWAAAGLSVRINDIVGGRREDAAPATGNRQPTDRVAPAYAGATNLVGRYYWPYRPFSISVTLTRPRTQAQLAMDQLIRVSPDQVQVLVRANVSAGTDGMRTSGADAPRLFGADFLLPDGYELLSVTGAAVADHFVQAVPVAQAAPHGRRLHVNFRSGVAQTVLSLVLVRRDAALGGKEPGGKASRFAVPSLTGIDPDGAVLERQTGRLAVQVAPAMDAQTAGSENLKPIAPASLSDWLEGPQIAAVRFAYRYELPGISLILDVRRQPRTVGVDVLAGLNVQPAAAQYTYRLRYQIGGSPIDHVSFTLPTRYAPLVAVSCPSMRSVTTSVEGDRTRWTIALTNEVTGALDVAANFAIPLAKAEEGVKMPLEVPRIVTDAPGGYHAVVAVQNYSGHELSVTEAKGLADVPAGEQKKLLAGEVLSWLQYVGQSFADDWSLELTLKPAKAGQRIQAVVDLLAMTTVIDRDGKSRYDVTVSLQNRSEQFLRVKVPPGLSLWSAQVAGQAVRPVTGAIVGGQAGAQTPAAAKDEVLIPLVKTSPGGLPYEVKMYFAGEGVTKLDGITRISPPAIAIAGVPVMRTTWSLRLPGGYRYVRPGGNVSPAASEAEVMGIALDAKMGQLARLEMSYRDAKSSDAGKSMAQNNWQAFNNKLDKDVQDYDSYVERNRGNLSQTEYTRNKDKVAELKGLQSKANTSWGMEQDEENKRSKANINTFVNGSLVNPGVSEVVRNEGITTIPAFVRQSSEEQKKEIVTEMRETSRLQPQGGFGGEGIVLNGVAGTMMMDREMQSLSGGLDIVSNQGSMLVQDQKQKEQVQEVLQSLQGQQQAQASERQDALKREAAKLGDNRMERYYGNNSFNASDNPVAVSGGEKLATGGGREGGQIKADTGAIQSGSGKDLIPQRSAQGLPKSSPASSRRMSQLEIAAAPQEDKLILTDGVTAYAASATYSLPMALPEGEVRLDFSRPGGDAEVSVWAVPVETIHGLYGTLVVLAGLAVAGLVWKLGGRLLARRRAAKA